MNSSFIRNLSLLAARIGLGVVLAAHGWQKFHDNGLAGTAAGFGKMGVPAPTASAYFATFVELVGGAALILGAFTGLVGLLAFLDMLGAFLLVHVTNGVFVGEGGYELVVAIGAGALLLAVFGAGAFSVDGVIGKKLGWAAGLSKA
jgi:putative oxidoreductase